MRVDPIAGLISDSQSLNRYAYVRNDPVNLTDPLGLDPPLPSDPRFPGSIWCSWVPWACRGQFEGPQGDAKDPEVGSGGGVVIPPPPSQGHTKCHAADQIPTDPGEHDAVAVVLGEGTSLGRMNGGEYQDDDKLGEPSGPYALTTTDFSSEAEAFVSVIANRANAPGFPKTWYAVIHQANQFHGLNRGLALLEQYKASFEGSTECAALYWAVYAVYFVKNSGPTNNFLYWVAVFNDGYRHGHYARTRRPGDFRIADTDFSANAF